jgi:hypothetical protein
VCAAFRIATRQVPAQHRGTTTVAADRALASGFCCESHCGKFATPAMNSLSIPQLPPLRIVMSQWPRRLSVGEKEERER